MTATFPWLFHATDRLEPFFIWLDKNLSDARAESLLTLLAAHEAEDSVAERENIRRTIAEILQNAPVLA